MSRGATPPRGRKAGSGRNYVRGRAKEYRAMDYLRAKGYAVMRSAKSHGPADLLAGKPVEPRPGSKVLAVQVKGGSAAFTQEDARALAGFAAAFNAVPVLCGRFGKWWLVVPTGAEGLTTTFGLKPLEDWWF